MGRGVACLARPQACRRITREERRWPCLEGPTLLLEAHRMMGLICFFRGAFTLARTYLEQGIDPTMPPPHPSQVELPPGQLQRLWMVLRPKSFTVKRYWANFLAEDLSWSGEPS